MDGWMDGAFVNMGQTPSDIFYVFTLEAARSLVLNGTIFLPKRRVGVHMEEQWRHGVYVCT